MPPLAVVKIGTSSLTDDEGIIDRSMVARLCRQIAGLRADGTDVVLVTSAAIAAGLPELGLGGDRRPSDPITLQAVATVGQSALMEVYRAEFAAPPAAQIADATLYICGLGYSTATASSAFAVRQDASLEMLSTRSIDRL